MASSISLAKKLKEQEASKPGTFTYQKQKPVYSFTEKKPVYSYDDTDLKSYYDKLMNREDFSFDINGNALFNQYKDFYQKQGQMAMMDTMGQASALTGGYGNSYAASAGQQAYQQNLDQLNAVVPELYQLALQQYQMEGENLQNIYGMLADDRDFAYQKYRGDTEDYYTDRDFAYQQYRGETDDYYADRDFAYGQYRDKVSDWYTDRDYLYGQYTDQRDYEYTVERDKVADQQWQKEYGLKVQQFAEEVRQFEKQYNLSEREFEEMCRQFAMEYNLDERKLAEDVRQYNESMAFNQQQAAISNSQWQQEFDYRASQDAVSNSQWEKEFARATEQDRLDNEYSDEEGSDLAGFIGKLGMFVGDTFNNGGSPTESVVTNAPAPVEDFEITATDEYFLNSFSKLLNDYGVDANDNVAILELLQSPNLGLSKEEIRKYYYALTS